MKYNFHAAEIRQNIFKKSAVPRFEVACLGQVQIKTLDFHCACAQSIGL